MIDFLEPVEMPKIGLESPISELIVHLEQLRGCNSFLSGFATDAHVVTPEAWLSQLGTIYEGAAFPDMESVESIEAHIRDLHRAVVGETGGNYRRIDYVPGLMWDLARFLRVKHPSQFDFFKTAFVFRRLLWIHPFPTENLAVARALAREMLAGIVGNPVLRLFDFSVAFADDDSDNGRDLLVKSESTLRGILRELERATRLSRMDYVRTELLEPALQNLEHRRVLNDREMAAMKVAASIPEFGAQELAGVWGDQFLRSRCIRKMLADGLIVPLKQGGRKYTLNLARLLQSKP